MGVIDAGAWHMRAGWAGEELPARAFRSVLAKTRREKGRASELLAGHTRLSIDLFGELKLWHSTLTADGEF